MSDVKKSPVEGFKESSQQLRGTIADELEQDSTHFGKSDVNLLKFHGTYQQDDREARKNRKPGEGRSVREYMFMVRTRIPGGRVTHEQLMTHLYLADRYGNGTLRITSRQGLQLHGILKSNLKKTIHDINQSLLTTLGACGDVERNVMCCPAPIRGVRDELQKVADSIAQYLAPRTKAYHEIWIDGEKQTGLPGPGSPPEEPIYGKTYLPRKFKTAITLPDDNCCDVLSNDLGFVAIVEQDDLVGFNVYVGGGMGMYPAKKHTFPALAKPLGFVGVDDVIDIATAVVSVQRDFGRRDDRHQARLKYLIHKWGIEKFKSAVEEYYGETIAPMRETKVRGFDHHLGWHDQGDGKRFIGVNIENGRIQDTETSRSKAALRELCQKYGSQGLSFRMTAIQSVLLSDVKPEWSDDIDEILDRNHVLDEPRLSNARKLSMACPALPTCGLAITESERVLPGLIDQLDGEIGRLGLEDERFAIHMTGCPNGCARPYNCDIGLVGKASGRYTVMLGGDISGTRLNVVYRDAVPAEEIVSTLVEVLERFRDEREGDEALGDFCHRVQICDVS